jgi:hypothetical protein
VTGEGDLGGRDVELVGWVELGDADGEVDDVPLWLGGTVSI